MNIKLKGTETRWVTIEDAEFKIDYPNIEQQDEINELQYQLSLLQFVNRKDETEEEYAERYLRELDSLPIESKAKIETLGRKICRLYIKYSIKDWKNINDENGNPVKCKIVNNAIEDELFNNFIKDMSFLELLTFFNAIKPKVEFTDTDKKKL